MRPLIGITSYAEEVPLRASGRSDAALVPLAYVRAVEHAGGRPLLVPPSEDGSRRRSTRSTASSSRAAPTSTRQLYGPSRTPRPTSRSRGATAPSSRCSRRRSTRDMPVLAICRGSQLLNVARGGDLVQHLPEVGRARASTRTRPALLRPRRLDRGREPARRAARRARAGEVAPPPGHGRDRRGPARGRVGRGRHWSRASRIRQAVRARRALAPGGRRGLRALRGARRGGARATGEDARVTAVLNPATEEPIAERRRAASAEETDAAVARAPGAPSRPGARSRPPTAARLLRRLAGARRGARRGARAARDAQRRASRSPTRAARSAWSPTSSTSTRARSTSTTARRSRSRAAST